jgi:hypothetical protein
MMMIRKPSTATEGRAGFVDGCVYQYNGVVDDDVDGTNG